MDEINERSEGMNEWFKKHKFLVIVILFCILVGGPFVIHCLFKIQLSEKYSFFIAEWTAGELLQYYGGGLAFLGTIILGALSLYQNDIIKQESDKRIELQEKREHDANMPRFRVKHLLCNGNLSNMVVTIENISDNVANDILVFRICVVKGSDVVWSYPNSVHYEVIRANDSIEVGLRTEAVQEKGVSIQFDFKCKDKYGDEHVYHVWGFCETNITPPMFQVKEVMG